jgi:hypothetical protein
LLRPDVLRALALVVAVRTLVLAAGALSLWLAAGDAVDPIYATGVPLVAWDSFYYREILVHGYPPAPGAVVAFFPAFPLAARPLLPLLSPEAALLLVANVCTVAGLGVAYVWARMLMTPNVALAGTLLAAAYPPAAFLSAAYTEGPFLLMVALTFLAMQRDAWYAAAIASGIATACRPTGVALAAVVWLGAAGVAWRRYRGARTLLALAALGVIAFSGAIAYELFLWNRYGDPRVYLTIQRHWDSAEPAGPAPVLPKHTLADPLSWGLETTRTALAPWPAIERRVTSLSVWNKGWTLLLLIVTAVGFVAPGPVPRLLFAVPLLIFLVGYLPNRSTLSGQVRIPALARYETAALPCFYLVAWWLRDRRRLAATLIATLLAFQLLYAAAISRGWWAG